MPNFGSDYPPTTSTATKHLSKSAGCSCAGGNESSLLGGVRLQPSNTPLRTQAETCSQLSCALNSQKPGREKKKTKKPNKTSSFLSLLPCFCLFFFFLCFFPQIPTTAVPTLGKWNISCKTWTDVNRVLLQQGSFTPAGWLSRRLCCATPIPVIPGMHSANSFLSSLV